MRLPTADEQVDLIAGLGYLPRAFPKQLSRSTIHSEDDYGDFASEGEVADAVADLQEDYRGCPGWRD